MGLAVDRQPAERAPVALGDAAGRDGGLDAGREVEQAERVGDGGTGAPDAGGDPVRGEAELVAIRGDEGSFRLPSFKDINAALESTVGRGGC